MLHELLVIEEFGLGKTRKHTGDAVEVSDAEDVNIAA